MKAILLIGHGALNKASGASMIRHAALLKKETRIDFATAGFLNFSEPTFEQAFQRCLSKGATDIIVQPYFLIDGYYVHTKLRQLVEEAQAKHPNIKVTMMQPFGDHPVLADLVIKRISESAKIDKQTAIVLMAHGTPHPEANAPIYKIAKRVEGRLERPVAVAFMECNTPTISDTIQSYLNDGFETVIATPYFLQSGRHVREDLPQIVAACKAQYPNKTIWLTQHLDYDEQFISIITERINKHIAGQIRRNS